MPLDVLFDRILVAYQKAAAWDQIAAQKAEALLLRVQAQKRVQEEMARAEAEVEAALQEDAEPPVETEVGAPTRKQQQSGSNSQLLA